MNWGCFAVLAGSAALLLTIAGSFGAASAPADTVSGCAGKPLCVEITDQAQASKTPTGGPDHYLSDTVVLRNGGTTSNLTNLTLTITWTDVGATTTTAYRPAFSHGDERRGDRLHADCDSHVEGAGEALQGRRGPERRDREQVEHDDLRRGSGPGRLDRRRRDHHDDRHCGRAQQAEQLAADSRGSAARPVHDRGDDLPRRQHDLHRPVGHDDRGRALACEPADRVRDKCSGVLFSGVVEEGEIPCRRVNLTKIDAQANIYRVEVDAWDSENGKWDFG